MKGTALDTAKARRALLNSQKEIAEHATIVDLIRNDLSQVAKKVRVTDYRYFHKIATSRRGLVQTNITTGLHQPSAAGANQHYYWFAPAAEGWCKPVVMLVANYLSNGKPGWGQFYQNFYPQVL